MSLSHDKIPWRQPVPLHLWVDNPSSLEAYAMTCSTLDFFWSRGFDLYDAYGHRLLRKVEVEQRKRQELQKNDSFAVLDCLMVCGRNIALPIPVYTCRNAAEPGLAYDFNRDLAQMYDLPPGTYFVVPRTGKVSNDGCVTPNSTLNPAPLTGYLKFSVEEN